MIPAKHNHIINSELQLRFNRKKVKVKRKRGFYDTCHVQPHQHSELPLRFNRKEVKVKRKKNQPLTYFWIPFTFTILGWRSPQIELQYFW